MTVFYCEKRVESLSMRPPFLQLGDSANFAAYQDEFDKRYREGVTDVLGNLVVFDKDRCHHVCFKSEDTVHNKGPRSAWSQERAERIAWIKTALETPKYIRCSPTGNWVYMIEVEADQQNNLNQELFIVIVTAGTKRRPANIFFRTAYSISGQQWSNFKKTEQIYNAVAPPPLKPKKRKQK